MPPEVRAFSGTLPLRDAHEEVADARLSSTIAPAPKEAQREGGSPYRKSFRAGAVLFPRFLVMVEHARVGRLGAMVGAPFVISRRSSNEKSPWRELPDISGNIESNFIRPICMGDSIAPFRLIETHSGVVPVTPEGRILETEEARKAGYEHLANRMVEINSIWRSQGKTKYSFSQHLDYMRQLSGQLPAPALRVVFAASGTLPAACVIRDEKILIEHSLYWAAPDSDEEAHFLCTLLNSEAARRRAEQFQARGQFGARHFDKAMFNLPIPLFDANKSLHRELAEAGAQAEAVAASVELKEGEKFQRARKRLREALADDGIGGDIENLVEKLLGPV